MLMPGSWYLLLVFLLASGVFSMIVKDQAEASQGMVTAALPLSLRFSSRLCSVSLFNKAVPSLSSCSCFCPCFKDSPCSCSLHSKSESDSSMLAWDSWSSFSAHSCGFCVLYSPSLNLPLQELACKFMASW